MCARNKIHVYIYIPRLLFCCTLFLLRIKSEGATLKRGVRTDRSKFGTEIWPLNQSAYFYFEILCGNR